MRYITVVILILFMFANFSHAQQPKFFQEESFEHCTPCNQDTQVQDCGPFLRTYGSSNIVFSYCNGAVPNNPAGTQEAKDGKAYAGFSALSSLKNNTDYRGEKYIFLNREYIMFRLTTPLTKGNKYEVSFYLSLADESSFSAPAMSVCITKTMPTKADKWSSVLKESKTMFRINNPELLADSINWRRLEIPFIAVGGEQLIIIGVFENDIQRNNYNNINSNSKAKRAGAYYYIDEIKVVGL